MIAAWRCGFRHRAEATGALLLGLGVALIVVYVHSFEEWIFVVFDSQYLFAIVEGLVAGLTSVILAAPAPTIQISTASMSSGQRT
jgi:hypothetical protein